MFNQTLRETKRINVMYIVSHFILPLVFTKLISSIEFRTSFPQVFCRIDVSNILENAQENICAKVLFMTD